MYFKSSMKYIYLSSSQSQNVQSVMSEVHIKPLKGTMKVHDVVAAGDKLYTRETSCFCEDCFFSSDGEFSPSCA